MEILLETAEWVSMAIFLESKQKCLFSTAMHICIHQQYHKDFTKAGTFVKWLFKQKRLEMICTGPLTLEGATICVIKLSLPSSKATRKNISLRMCPVLNKAWNSFTSFPWFLWEFIQYLLPSRFFCISNLRPTSWWKYFFLLLFLLLLFFFFEWLVF